MPLHEGAEDKGSKEELCKIMKTWCLCCAPLLTTWFEGMLYTAPFLCCLFCMVLVAVVILVIVILQVMVIIVAHTKQVIVTVVGIPVAAVLFSGPNSRTRP